MNALFAIICLGGSMPSEQAASRPDVAGSYHFVGGMATNHLKMGQDGGYTLTVNNCQGYDRTERGTYRWDQDAIRLIKDKPDDHSLPANRIYPVQWGTMLFLIDEEELLGFCHLAYTGWRSESWRSGRTYTRRHNGIDYGVAGKSSPLVPARYKHVFESGFSAKVVRSLGKNLFLIDQGSEDGVSLNTRLRLDSSKDLLILRVVKAQSRESECELVGFSTATLTVGAKIIPY